MYGHVIEIIGILVLSSAVWWLYFRCVKKNSTGARSKLEAMLSSSCVFMGLLDLDGRFLLLNKAALKFLDQSGSDVMGKFFWDCPWWTNSVKKQNELKEAIKSVAEGKVVHFEVTHINSAGEKKIIDFSITPFKDEKDNIIYLVPEGKDITELRINEARLNKAQEVAHIGSWDWDVHKDNLWWANETYRIFRLDPKEFVPTYLNFLDLIHPDDRDDVVNAIKHSFEKKEHYSVIHRIIVPDGSYCMVQEHGDVIYDDDGNLVRMVGTVQDITEFVINENEKHAMEKELYQSRKMEAIGTLAGGIAHDFNNLLQVIMGNAELLRYKADEGSKVHEHSTYIIEAGKRATDLIKQILTFSRQSEGGMQPMCIGSHIKETIKLLRSSIPHSVNIKQNIPNDIQLIIADPTRIHQLLTNLVTNAMHAMQEKGELCISVTNVDMIDELADSLGVEGSYVCLSVSDTGCGMSEEVRNRIFDPFYTTKEVGKGTGMGLSVVHGIVKDMNGVIHVQTAVGKRTTFFVYFPVTKEPSISVSVNKSTLMGNERILFVDDEPMVADVGKNLLETLGYSVEVFNNSLEALKCFIKNPDNFDLLLTDQSMPQLTGEELIKEVLVIKPDLPIILCTGYSSVMDEKKSNVIGVKKFLMKPLELNVLAEALRESLK